MYMLGKLIWKLFKSRKFMLVLEPFSLGILYKVLQRLPPNVLD